MSVTPEVSHVEMWPYVASAAVASASHAATAGLIFQLTMALPLPAGMSQPTPPTMPHHVDALVADASIGFLDILRYRGGLKGICRAVLGSSWILHEPLTSIGFTDQRSINEQKQVALVGMGNKFEIWNINNWEMRQTGGSLSTEILDVVLPESIKTMSF